MIISVFDRVENIVGKGENAGYQHFLLFLQCFEKASFPYRHVKRYGLASPFPKQVQGPYSPCNHSSVRLKILLSRYFYI